MKALQSRALFIIKTETQYSAVDRGWKLLCFLWTEQKKNNENFQGFRINEFDLASWYPLAGDKIRVDSEAEAVATLWTIYSRTLISVAKMYVAKRFTR